MIGQDNLKNQIKELVSAKVYPRFSILVGPKGSGKKLLCEHIAKLLGATMYCKDCGIDAIREMIRESYQYSIPIVYVIPDADKMSLAAKNALLKVTEEPPNNAYFILTLTDIENTLDTIKSRGTVFNMEGYTTLQISEYANVDDEDAIILQDVCTTPGEVDLMKEYGVKTIYDYCVKVVDNIAEVSGSNAFKIGNKLKLKPTEDDKYDLALFWRIFISVCAKRLNDEPIRYSSGIKLTSRYLQELRITGINRQSTFDCWLLDIRREWM